MIYFKKGEQDLYFNLKHELKALYLSAFTQGVSAQHITDQEAENYLDKLFSSGYGIFGFSDEQLIAALISTPPSFDLDRPKHIEDTYHDSDSEYIAEVLVDSNFHGQGLGKKLMMAFEKHLDPTKSNVLLRVWIENAAAVGLYQKFGFKSCGHITQQKLKPNTKEAFIMHKDYMVKTY